MSLAVVSVSVSFLHGTVVLSAPFVGNSLYSTK